jgi:hypothetical protein
MTSTNASAATRSAELERIAHYREQAAQYRQWAADETVAEARDGLLDMARQYDRLAGELEAKTGITATRSPRSPNMTCKQTAFLAQPMRRRRQQSI